MRKRIPAPPQLAGARIEGAHSAARAVDAVVIGDRRPDDDEIAYDRRRRGLLIFAAAGDVGDAVGQVDLAGCPEIGAWRACCGIKGEQSSIDRRQKDAPAAGLALGLASVGPNRDTPIDEAFGIGRVQIDLRIEAPFFIAILGVERDDAIERRRQIHRAVENNRGGLEFALPFVACAVGDIAGVVLQGDLQFCDIALVDLAQRRIAAAARISAVVRPIGSLPIGRLCPRGRSFRRGGKQDRRDHCRPDTAPTSLHALSSQLDLPLTAALSPQTGRGKEP